MSDTRIDLLVEQLRPLVKKYGIRPVLDNLAHAIEGMCFVKLDSKDEDDMDDEDVDTIAANLRNDLF